MVSIMFKNRSKYVYRCFTLGVKELRWWLVFPVYAIGQILYNMAVQDWSSAFDWVPMLLIWVVVALFTGASKIQEALLDEVLEDYEHQVTVIAGLSDLCAAQDKFIRELDAR